jgi:hypothetical protein
MVMCAPGAMRGQNDRTNGAFCPIYGSFQCPTLRHWRVIIRGKLSIFVTLESDGGKGYLLKP